jgi:hypothetical protein
MSSSVETASDIRPFHVDIQDETLEDLRRRIAATNWPEKSSWSASGRILASTGYASFPMSAPGPGNTSAAGWW